ncbi:MAG: SpoIID/LytB domain-containing protein [Bacteroidota bacterium]
MLISCKSRIVLSLMLSFIITPMYAEIRIALLGLDRPLSLTVNIREGSYRMLADGRYYYPGKDDNILLVKAGDKVLVSIHGANSILSDSVLIESDDRAGCFSVRNNIRGHAAGVYYGDLTVIPDIRALLAINSVDEENYLAGVVRTEAGPVGHIEFYKAQAMLARTYLYMNTGRHKRDGYDLCDKVHCQAYHGRSDVPIIYEAVNATRNRVLVNPDSLLVFTPFHSNCGGETQSSAYVWLTDMKHLQGVTDPYCRYSRNATWTKEIAMDEWIAYLGEHGYRHVNESDLNYDQPGRKKDYRADSFLYPLVNIREDWALRSTFFSAAIRDNSIILSGRGYGHGVGLCQEGARVMSERGFLMEEILAFYFKDLVIIDIKDVKASVQINSAF